MYGAYNGKKVVFKKSALQFQLPGMAEFTDRLSRMKPRASKNNGIATG